MERPARGFCSRYTTVTPRFLQPLHDRYTRPLHISEKPYAPASRLPCMLPCEPLSAPFSEPAELDFAALAASAAGITVLKPQGKRVGAQLPQR